MNDLAEELADNTDDLTNEEDTPITQNVGINEVDDHEHMEIGAEPLNTGIATQPTDHETEMDIAAEAVADEIAGIDENSMPEHHEHT